MVRKCCIYAATLRLFEAPLHLNFKPLLSPVSAGPPGLFRLNFVSVAGMADGSPVAPLAEKRISIFLCAPKTLDLNVKEGSCGYWDTSLRRRGNVLSLKQLRQRAGQPTANRCLFIQCSFRDVSRNRACPCHILAVEFFTNYRCEEGGCSSRSGNAAEDPRGQFLYPHPAFFLIPDL